MNGEQPGKLWLESWAGRTSHQVKVLGETSRRVRVRLLEDIDIRGWRAGETRLVPKYAVTIVRDDSQLRLPGV